MADGIGDDGDSLVARRAGAGQGLGGGQQVRQAPHPDHPGAAEGGVEHRVLPAGRVPQPAAGVDRDHGAQPRRGAGRRHEAPAVLDAADVEQDRAGAGVAGQPVEHQAEADVGAAADADHVAEADAVRLRPVQHRPAQRRGLRNQRHPAGLRLEVRAGRVEAERRDDDPEGGRPEHPHPGRPPGVPQAGRRGQANGGKGAARRERPQRPRHAVRLGRDHAEAGRHRKCGDVRIGEHAADRAQPLSHRKHRAGELGAEHVPHRGPAQLGAGADDGDGFGAEQVLGVEAAGLQAGDQGHEISMMRCNITGPGRLPRQARTSAGATAGA